MFYAFVVDVSAAAAGWLLGYTCNSLCEFQVAFYEEAVACL